MTKAGRSSREFIGLCCELMRLYNMIFAAFFTGLIGLVLAQLAFEASPVGTILITLLAALAGIGGSIWSLKVPPSTYD